MVLASLIVAIVAILVAIASVAYTRRQAIEAANTRAIEQSRWHAELTPVLKVTGHRRDDEGNRAELRIELTGPAALNGLDEVIIRIRDDMPDPQPRFGSQFTQEQIFEVIWGPYRIVPGSKDTDAIGRTHGPFQLPKNEPYLIPLERSLPPSWVSGPESWHRPYEGRPVRLEIICKRQGSEPWVIPYEVDIAYV
jgi:hypothetical protein